MLGYDYGAYNILRMFSMQAKFVSEPRSALHDDSCKLYGAIHYATTWIMQW